MQSKVIAVGVLASIRSTMMFFNKGAVTHSLHRLPRPWSESDGVRTAVCTLVFGAILAAPNTGLRAQRVGAKPDTYSVTLVSMFTEPSMFTNEPAELQISRSGSKEAIEVTIAPSGAREGLRERVLFDFSAHKAYTLVLDQHICSWMSYVSSDAPVNWDPISGTDKLLRMMSLEAPEPLGFDDVNGIQARVARVVIAGTEGKPAASGKLWRSTDGGYFLKYVGPGPGGAPSRNWLEVNKLSFAIIPASTFTSPTGCTESAGVWSDTELITHGSTKFDVETVPKPADPHP